MIKVVKLKLREIIKKRGHEGVPYRDLAKKLGISHVALWKMLNQDERQKKAYTPSLAMLDKLCTFFKCKPGDLLEYKRGSQPK